MDILDNFMQTAAGVGGVLFRVAVVVGLLLATGRLLVRLRRKRPHLSCMTAVGDLIMASMFALPGFAMGAYVGSQLGELVGVQSGLTCLGGLAGVLLGGYFCVLWWRSATQ